MPLSFGLGAHTMCRTQAVYAGRKAAPQCQLPRGLERTLPVSAWERILCAAPRQLTREERPLLNASFLADRHRTLSGAAWERILCAAPKLFTREERPLLNASFLADWNRALPGHDFGWLCI